MKKTALFLVAATLFTLSAAAQAQRLSQWRGTDRKGIYPETRLLKSWPAAGPTMLWAADGIGNGYGSPTVTADRIFVTGEVNGLSTLFALDRRGKLLWKSEFGKEWVRSYAGSRSQPTVVGDLVYVCSGNGVLACFEAGTGKKRWAVDMVKDFQGRLPYHGQAESPLVDGDRVFLVPGGPVYNVVALNRFTGQLVWNCRAQGETPAYNSPNLVKLTGRNLVVTFTAYSLLGIDAKTGDLLWRHEQDNTPVAKRAPGVGDTHSNTVWYEQGFLYYFAGDGNGAVKLSLSKDGRTVRQVWRNPGIDNYMGGFVKLGNGLYSPYPTGKQLIGVDAGTGKVLSSLPLGPGAVIAADNMLYYYSEKGEVTLVKPAGVTLTTCGTLKVTRGTKEHWAHPVIKDGTLFVRHGTSLMAYQIR